MKTIFITFAASILIPLSYGATVLTLNSNDLQVAGGTYNLTEGIGSGYGNISITMALDSQAFQSAILSGNVKGNIFTANDNKLIGLGLNYVSTGTPSAGMYGSWSGGDYNRSITPINETAVNLSTGLKDLFSDNTYTSIAVTYQITSTGTWTYLTLVDSEGVATTISGQDSALKGSGFGALTSFTYGTDYVKHLVVDNSALNYNDSVAANLAAITAASVPEPTTASLGLAGLALLMMRRKRA